MLIKKTNTINLDQVQWNEIKNKNLNPTIPSQDQNNSQSCNKTILCQRFEYNQIGNYTLIKDLNKTGRISGYIILKEHTFLFSHYQMKFVIDCLFSKDLQLCVIIASQNIFIYQLVNFKLQVNQYIDLGQGYKYGVITSDSKYLIINTHENTIILYCLQKLTQILTIYQYKPNFNQIFVSKTNNVMFSIKFGSPFIKRWIIEDDKIKLQSQFYLNHTYTISYITKHYILIRKQFGSFESMYCIFSNLNRQRKLIRTIKSSFFENLQIDPNCDSNILIDNGNKLQFQVQYKIYSLQTGHFKQASQNYNKLHCKPGIEISENQIKIEYFEFETQD
ncbi:unnamed protein product [Paramecium sonneborni]|uniref:Uncharacterized protein n=1 Tax=Paramecium sonneborni TaxID=65129 RepID=A0A8S1QWB1_9CILI|nr:unnamed protein product [Paramecium sonneborni]